MYLASRDGFTEQIVRDLPRIESGQIGLKDIPRVWKGPDGQAGEGGGTGTFDAPSRLPPLDVLSKDGKVLFSVKTGASGASSAVFAKPIAQRLDDDFWADVKALIEKRLA